MKLIVNKKEAELLKDVTLIENRNEVAVSLYNDSNVQRVTVGYEGEDKITGKTSKGIAIGFNNGELFIGISNRYGNGYREIPLNALETLLWGGDEVENMKALQENRSKYKIV